MSFTRRSNGTSQKVTRESSIPSNIIENKKKKNTYPPQTKKPQNKGSQLIDKKRNIKVDYNSNNYFYNEEDYDEEDNYNKSSYYDKNQKSFKYNNQTNDSYVSVEQEDGHIEYMPKNYVDNSATPPMYNSTKIEYYEENSEDSENHNENDNIYYENDEVYEQDLLNNPSSMDRYKKYQKINKYYLTQDNHANNNKNKKNNQNAISRPINPQINNFKKELKRKGHTTEGNMRNCGNSTTTTNNTYNNNIYYINPINVQNKNQNKKEENNGENKKSNISNRKNYVYKNVDITINTKKPMKERDYFRINNIERSKRQKYINAAILIQSIFRGYLIKIKLYNNVNLYVCCKKSIEILEKLIFIRKKKYWKYFKSIISHMHFEDLLNSKLSLNILKDYLRNDRDSSKEKKINYFHKELGDSFKIVVDKKQKENNEKKLKLKLNDVIKENKELKNQLSDNRNIEEKMKTLIDENKKNKNINDIIMKDNQQLAKKLKDIQDYRNTNLFVEYQPSVDLTQKQQMQIEELIKNNEINLNKLKKNLFGKIINKKINFTKNIIKDNFNKFRNIVENIKKEEKKKDIYLKNCLNNLENKFKLIKQKYFWSLYYSSIILDKETKLKNNLKKELLKKIVNNKEKNINFIIYKSFFKYHSNIIKLNNEDLQIIEEEEQDKEFSKKIILNKIIKRCQKNQKLIYKIFIEKWNLKAKIIGMRAAARDKKKKRKLKKKNNRLLYEKHFGIADKKNNSNNLGPKLCKSIHEFSYIVSNGAVIKESSSNENAEINVSNNKDSASSDKINKINKLDKRNLGVKKNNSVNEKGKQNNQKNLKKESNKEDNKENENLNANEDSEEDSGDSLGLDDE